MEQLQPLAAENLRKLAKQFYATAYHHLFQQRDQNSPIVNAYHIWLRKLNGVITPFDVMEQNELEASIFIFLFEHNLLFQLTVLGRFDLIQILWREGNLSNKDRFLLNSMIEELIRGNHPQFLTPHRVKILQPENLQGLMHLMNASSKVLNFYLYCALHEEYQRQVFKYHVEQSIYYELAIDEVIKISSRIIEDSMISAEAKAEARKLYQESITAKEKLSLLKDKKILYANNKLNLMASAKFNDQSFNEFLIQGKALHSLFNHREVKKYFGAEQKKFEKLEKKINVSKKKYDAIIQQFEKRLSQKDFVISEVKNIDEVIKAIEIKIPLYMNYEQKPELNEHLNYLKNLKSSLVALQGPFAIKKVFGECARTLSLVVTLTQPVIELAAVTTFIKQTQETFLILSKHQASEQVYTFADKVNFASFNIKAELNTLKEEQTSNEIMLTGTNVQNSTEVIDIPDEFREELKEKIYQLNECLEDMKVQEPEEKIFIIIEKIESALDKLKTSDLEAINNTNAIQLIEDIKKLAKSYPEDEQLGIVLGTFNMLATGFEDVRPTAGLQ